LQGKLAPVYSYFYAFKLSRGFGEILSGTNVDLGIYYREFDIDVLYDSMNFQVFVMATMLCSFIIRHFMSHHSHFPAMKRK
jgi:hypothetical protein